MILILLDFYLIFTLINQFFSLQNINFRAKRGELFGIVGLSGSGKSTLLNIIAGHIILDQGHLFFEGGRASENLYLTGGEKELFARH